MRIDSVRFETGRPDALRAFYAGTLELPVTDVDGGLAVTVGGTTVEFAAANGDPWYHYAVDVPRDRFAEARDWLADRVDLLAYRATGEHTFSHDSMDADAVYFRDTAGNVGELIARRGLDTDADTDAPFGPDDLLRVSEVGLPVDDVATTLSSLEPVGLEAWPDWSETFAVVGDDEAMFIVVPTGRDWFPTDGAAEAHPVRVGLTGIGASWTHDEYPYRIEPTSPDRAEGDGPGLDSR